MSKFSYSKTLRFEFGYFEILQKCLTLLSQLCVLLEETKKKNATDVWNLNCNINLESILLI